MGLRVDELDSWQATVESWLPQTATVVRTGDQSPCSIEDAGRTTRLQGLPTYIRVHEWLIRLRDGLDTEIGDRIEIAGLGRYAIIDDLNPTTRSTSTDLMGVRVSPTVDGGELPVTPNARGVTFTNPLAAVGVPPVTADVFIYPADMDVKEYGLDPAFKWAVLFDPALAYTDGALIGEEHQLRIAAILGSKTGGMARSAALSSPRRTLGPLPLATAYFKEGA
jgi:hypothetical protein